MARQRSPASGARRSPSRTSTGTGGRTSSTFSRASAAASGERSVAITRSKCPSTASESAMQPHPVPTSAATPPPPTPRSTFHVPRGTRRVQSSTNWTRPSVSGRGIKARRSRRSSSRRKLARPTAYANGTPLARRSAATRNRSASPASGSRSRPSQTSPGLTPGPATAAQSAVASRRASVTPERCSRSAASASTSAIEQRPATARSRTEAFLLPRQPQRVDQLVQVAVDHIRKVVNRVVDAVICDPILREVVRPDLGRAVAGANLGPPLPRPRGLLLGEDAVKQPSPEDLECLYLVLELGLLVLALNHEIGREVGDPYRAVRGVDALATRA